MFGLRPNLNIALGPIICSWEVLSLEAPQVPPTALMGRI